MSEPKWTPGPLIRHRKTAAIAAIEAFAEQITLVDRRRKL